MDDNIEVRDTDVLTIKKFPHPILHHECKTLKVVDGQLKSWVNHMIEIMYEHNGVGLAAPQVGLPYRFFVMNSNPPSKESEQVYINPIITNFTNVIVSESEGCLSFPGIMAPVKRFKGIKFSAYDIAGNHIRRELSGLEARIFQHEIDHLDGKMFFERCSDFDLDRIQDHIFRANSDWNKDITAEELHRIYDDIIELENERT